jgi:SAM-dependent methyltransferase
LIETTLQRYGPSQPLRVLVDEVNKLYHEHEAAGYEATHPEIFEQLPPLWRKMLATFDSLPSVNDVASSTRGPKLRILNLGCGTGFEAGTCLSHLGRDRIERLVCYDPSEEMLEQSRRTLAAWGDLVEYVSASNSLLGQFDVLVTNAVLHHMLDPVQAILDIAPLLSPGAAWLCGHEPSRRFYANSECMSVLRRHEARHGWTRFASPRKYLRRFLRSTGLIELPADYAARRAFEQSLFKRRPPAWLISRLVDYQIVLRDSELEGGRGLDFTELQCAFEGVWKSIWRATYSFLGPHYEGELSAHWRSEAKRLSANYPDDGASCCLVWRRT